MNLRPGQRLYSSVSSAQVIVVRAPAVEIEIGCGGVPMVEDEGPGVGADSLDSSLGEGPAIGKRYADDEVDLELLCTKTGDGALTVDGRVLAMRGAKPLPSSD